MAMDLKTWMNFMQNEQPQEITDSLKQAAKLNAGAGISFGIAKFLDDISKMNMASIMELMKSCETGENIDEQLDRVDALNGFADRIMEVLEQVKPILEEAKDYVEEQSGGAELDDMLKDLNIAASDKSGNGDDEPGLFGNIIKKERKKKNPNRDLGKDLGLDLDDLSDN